MYLIIDMYGGPAEKVEDLTTEDMERLQAASYTILDIFDPEEPLECRGGEWHVIPDR